MAVGPKCIAELEDFEGDKSFIYPDSRGLLTIGIGHLLTKDELSSGKIIICGEVCRIKDGLDEDHIQALLNQDLKSIEDAIARLVKVSLTQCQYDALVSFTFNVGSGALAGSTLLKLLNAGEYDQVPAQILRWTHNHNGTVNAALRRRRVVEARMWAGENE